MTLRSKEAFASQKARPAKRRAGRTPVSETPLHIRVSGLELPPKVAQKTRALLGRRLARFGTSIERADVRFKDINGPARGGIDTRCRINLTVSGRPAVFVEERALDAERALTQAASSVTRAMTRSIERKGSAVPPPTRTAARKPTRASSSPKRQGLVYLQETATATRPSRKSTRKSPNRQKGGTQLARRTRRRKHTPKARAARAQQQRQRARASR
jgi:hypothetical protein